MQVVTRISANLNGITIAYVMGLVNAALACLLAFGVNLDDNQTAAVGGLVNAALILAVHVGHRVGETAFSGASHQKAVETMAQLSQQEPPPAAPPASAS